ncbi:eukaryotic translation initiation factor 4E-binding protein 1 [Belonocnema kinseyi]|uniref:eukaryotic translation initiation factor 4E-binding protein 1 n=1 Tax=Belonocnema kinseyi TaxID=2817044 RepID=UPI00143D2844|nr:eukaryotic translation initiation factor 4E-binding protein 1 [Belonocnema kinseyi]
MSASPIARQATQSQSIPSKRVVIHDPNQLPADYSSTPGGTIFSTTPGGTRIVYDRAFLMNLRNSPISRTPPKNLNTIPASLQKSPVSDAITPSKISNGTTIPLEETPAKVDAKETPVIDETGEQFEMDM